MDYRLFCKPHEGLRPPRNYGQGRFVSFRQPAPDLRVSPGVFRTVHIRRQAMTDQGRVSAGRFPLADVSKDTKSDLLVGLQKRADGVHILLIDRDILDRGFDQARHLELLLREASRRVE